MNFQDDFQHQKNNRRTRWMVSYSDFATVLLAVFIVFYVSTNVELIEAKEKIAELENSFEEGKVSDEYKSKYQAALPFLEKAVQMPDANAQTWELLGRVYSVLGQQDDANNAFKKADELRK